MKASGQLSLRIAEIATILSSRTLEIYFFMELIYKVTYAMKNDIYIIIYILLYKSFDISQRLWNKVTWFTVVLAS